MKGNKLLTLILIAGSLLQFCSGQNSVAVCNRNVSDKSLEKLLPTSVCLPGNVTAFKIVNDFDFDGDGLRDLAIRCVEFPLVDGNMISWLVYRKAPAGSYLLKSEFGNLSVPHIELLSDEYLRSHRKADSLSKIYPAKLDLSFRSDSIIVTQFIPEYYGKDIIFLYDASRKNWYLSKIEYWIGNVPQWLVENANLSEKLFGKIVLEEKLDRKGIAIDEFNLINSKKNVDDFEMDYLMNKYDIYDWAK